MLLLIDKPVGPTSFDLVKKAKKIWRGEKIGHSGTLDPLASGLMILGIGKSTKLLYDLTGLDKSYTANIDFLQWSDTWDSDSWQWKQTYPLDSKQKKIAKKRGWKNFQNPETLKQPTFDEIDTYCTSLLDINELLLAPFSAKKYQGKKLYEYARAGNPLIKKSPMRILKIEIISYSFPILKINVTVGSGTYIRSIAQTIGNHFGLGGIVTSLRRTTIGKYSVNQLK